MRNNLIPVKSAAEGFVRLVCRLFLMVPVEKYIGVSNKYSPLHITKRAFEMTANLSQSDETDS